MLANRARKHALRDERINELRKVLTPVQQATLVLLLPQLERESRNSSATSRASATTVNNR